jgi:uncharacterized protein (TIGR00730 family)
MSKIASVAVFCGSRAGSDPAFAAAAKAMGEGLAERGLRLVYGAGGRGLMGILANAALAKGGAVLGVIPEFLVGWEVGHDGLTERVVTRTMHERKKIMAEASDVFVALPGGIGTLDEIVEILSWRQLRLHDKPIYVCDINGSGAAMKLALETAITQGFASPELREMCTIVSGVDAFFQALED